MDKIISFPILGGLTLNPPSSFEVFGFTIHLYGVIIALGLILGVLYAKHMCPRFGMKFDDIIDFLLLAVPVCVVSARLYYVVFNFGLYRDDPITILYIWKGGLAFYGALIGGLLSVWIFCRWKKLPLGPLLDLGCMGLLIGQAIGRWGNFVNREAFGTSANIAEWPLRMGLTDPITGATTYVHPTFLYESLWYGLGVLLLHLFIKKGKRKFDGEMGILYFIWNGLGRAVVEGLRTDSLYILNTGIRVSQLLAVLLVVLGVVLLAVNLKKCAKTPAVLLVDRVAMAACPALEAETDTPAENVPAAEENGENAHPEAPSEDPETP